MSRAIIKRIRPKPGFKPDGPFFMAGYWYNNAASPWVWERGDWYVSPEMHYRMEAARAQMAQAITTNYDTRGTDYNLSLIHI